MENKLNIYDFKDQPVRIVDRDGEPWFVATDVCRVLQIENTSQAVARLHEDEKGICSNDTLGGKQKAIVVNESGLYALIFTSRKAEAQDFRKWVTHEVLPAIRKTGRYEFAGNAEALPEVPEDPEIQWGSVIGFLRWSAPARQWSVNRMIYFALTVRRAAKGFGIEWRTEFDERLGRVQIVPVGLLHWCMVEIIKRDFALTDATGGANDIDIETLVLALGDGMEPGEKREFSFQRLFEIARDRTLFGLKAGSELDQTLRSTLGRRVAAHTGKRFGVDLVFDAKGNFRRRVYTVRRRNQVPV